LVTGISQENPMRPASVAADAMTRATLSIAERGKPATRWEPAEVAIADAAGNSWTDGWCEQDDPAKRLQGGFSGLLWPGEVAWKLRIELARNAGLAPHELWTVRRAPWPERGKRRTSSATRCGIDLRLELSADTGPDGVEFIFAHVTAAKVQPGWRVDLISATDEHERALRVPAMGWYAPLPREQPVHNSLFHVPMPRRRPRFVDLTFAVQRTRSVEFLVKPDRASSAPPVQD
jgi:hypothetical protein